MTDARTKDGCLLGLDVGMRRIGVSRALPAVGFARPLKTLDNPDTFMQDIAELAVSENAAGIVLGLPRGLDGQETAQTAWVRQFAETLAGHVDVPLYWTDEAVTSAQAEKELASRGKPYTKGDIDALAATYILDDYLASHREAGHV